MSRCRGGPGLRAFKKRARPSSGVGHGVRPFPCPVPQDSSEARAGARASPGGCKCSAPPRTPVCHVARPSAPPPPHRFQPLPCDSLGRPRQERTFTPRASISCMTEQQDSGPEGSWVIRHLGSVRSPGRACVWWRAQRPTPTGRAGAPCAAPHMCLRPRHPVSAPGSRTLCSPGSGGLQHTPGCARKHSGVQLTALASTPTSAGYGRPGSHQGSVCVCTPCGYA